MRDCEASLKIGGAHILGSHDAQVADLNVKLFIYPKVCNDRSVASFQVAPDLLSKIPTGLAFKVRVISFVISVLEGPACAFGIFLVICAIAYVNFEVLQILLLKYCGNILHKKNAVLEQ